MIGFSESVVVVVCVFVGVGLNNLCFAFRNVAEHLRVVLGAFRL
jgi:hypothetical protein